MAELRGRFGSMPEAEAFFRQKINLPTRRWDDLWQGQHTRAFVVAGATRDALLSDLREAVDAAISKGETLEDFRARFRELVARNGWTGWTGEGTAAGEAWRTSVIYHTNLRTAYQAGRWETLKSFPYLKYQHNTVANPRESHQAWDGKIIATDDPWWKTHYPPNGWGCRCSVTGVSAARLRAEGRRPDEPPPGVRNDPPPEWAYNVGEAANGRYVEDQDLSKRLEQKWQALPAKPHQEWGRPDALPIDRAVASPLPKAPRDPDAVRADWNQLYGDVESLRDPSGAEVFLTPQVVDHWLEQPKRLDGRERYLPLLRETIEAPFEIWANFAQNELGRVGLRRYYVKRVEVVEDGKMVALTLIAEVLPGGRWGSIDFFRGRAPQVTSRSGLLVWGRG